MGTWYLVKKKEYKEYYQIVKDLDFNMVVVDYYRQENEEENPKLIMESFSISRSKLGKKLKHDEWSDFIIGIEL